ncbi:Adk1 [Trypoxylus dichotomus]
MEKPKRKCKCATKCDKHKIKVPIVWVIGGPGCGKGTQCDEIVKKYGFVHISSGDLIRLEAQKKPEESSNLVSVMESGKLISTELVLDLIRTEMFKHKETAKGFLIDGYPREPQQGVLFEEKIGPVSVILFFDASPDVLKERIMFRAKDSGRVDDNEETLGKRLQTYLELKDGIFKEFSQKIKVINANRAVDEIFKDVEKYLDPLVD